MFIEFIRTYYLAWDGRRVRKKNRKKERKEERKKTKRNE